MQAHSDRLYKALNENVEVRALPHLTAEWNQNRYAGLSYVKVEPEESEEDQNLSSFPANSIAEPNRPTRGIIKGRTAPYNPNWRHSLRGEEGFAVPDFSDRPGDKRYYTAGADAIYKYWTSAVPSSNSSNATGNYSFPQPQQLTLMYKRQAWTNKIVIGFENTWASPRNWRVQATSDGTTWTTVATNPSINAKGQAILYRQGTTWGKTYNLDNPVQLQGLRIIVDDLSRPDSFLNVIELSYRLERNLSEYVETFESSFSMSEPNFISPLGLASSNTASVTLNNVDGTFNNDNPKSMYYDLIEKNVQMMMNLVYTHEDNTTDAVRLFTMYVDDWTGPGQESITAELKDFSKFMQEQNCPSQLLEDVTIGEAVWRMCDSIGFVDYNYERGIDDPATNMKYFYTTGDDLVWDVFQKIAQDTQTAIYFDQFGVLQIKTRDAAYDKYNDVTWNFEATNAPDKLADIADLNTDYTFEANSVNVNYKTTRISDDQNGWPKMEVVWEPESSFVLRASSLTGHLTKDNDVFFQMNPKDSEVWPYEGMITVGGELIKYKGKEYAYYNTGRQLQRLWVYSQEEKDNIDNNLSDPDLSYKNACTGLFKIEERGVYWTEPLDHHVGIPQFRSEHFWYNDNNSSYDWGTNGGVSQDIAEGIITLQSNKDFEGNRILRASIGDPGFDQAFSNYGCRMRIPKLNGQTGGGGLFFFGGPGGAGYYVEVMKTDIFDVPGGPQRDRHGNEIGFFRRGGDGDFYRPKPEGVPLLVAPDKWYDVDVIFRADRPSPFGDYIHDISIYINGVMTMELSLPTGRAGRTGQYGVWLRGNNSIDFEYLYAHDKIVDPNNDDFSNYDRIRGGYASTAWERQFVFGENMNNYIMTGKTTDPEKQAHLKYRFDEFGPIIHEVREMDVPFEKGPVVHSRFYTSNDTQIVMPYYSGSPYGAKFMLANVSRDNAVANGEDLLMFGADDPVDQRSFIYGRLVYQEDEQTHTVKNEDAIRRRGKIEVSFDSEWLQSKAEAEALGAWILKHWGDACDQITMTVFGNPLLELTDLVTVNFPERNMTRDTHRYFVSSVSQTFENGLSTSVTLRRSKI